MTVTLRRPNDLPDPPVKSVWLATTDTPVPAGLAPDKKLPVLARRLEAAYDASRELWWSLSRDLGGEPTGDLARAPTASVFGSDFGLMLAWGQLVGELGTESNTYLVLCSDPWLFRHLAGLPGVEAGPPPPLVGRRLRLAIRGWLARARVCLTAGLSALRLHGLRRVMAPGDSVLLVYGHPESDARGKDAYFGDLMTHLPDLKRLMHTDCTVGRARELAADSRTASLHGWGHPLFALTLPFVFWRPSRQQSNGPYGYLVRRALAHENGGGGVAMNRWQAHCQNRWLAAVRPARVAWPWENHGWERNLCRAARRAGVFTIGYQHTVIGPHQINYAPKANPDGLAAVPDLVVSDGPAYGEELVAWGVPRDRLANGGAFRIQRPAKALFDPQGPVFVPLSAHTAIARQQLEAARRLAQTGTPVLIKEHPMYPVTFTEEPNLRRTDIPMPDQQGLSAVLFATGATGLEAVLLGLPTVRLMLEDRISVNVLPASVTVPAATLDDVATKVSEFRHPPKVAWDSIFTDPVPTLWREWLFGDMHLGIRSETANPSTQEAS